VRRVRLDRKEREREDIGGAAPAQVGYVEAGELGIVGEDESDGGWFGGSAGEQGSPQDPRQGRRGEEPGHARLYLDVQTEGRKV
jgi:hypothetical protein